MDWTIFGVAGIGGLALAAVVYIFREIIRTGIFPQLTKNQAYSLLNKIVLAIFVLGVLGLLIYFVKPGTDQKQNESNSSKPSPSPTPSSSPTPKPSTISSPSPMTQNSLEKYIINIHSSNLEKAKKIRAALKAKIPYVKIKRSLNPNSGENEIRFNVPDEELAKDDLIKILKDCCPDIKFEEYPMDPDPQSKTFISVVLADEEN